MPPATELAARAPRAPAWRCECGASRPITTTVRRGCARRTSHLVERDPGDLVPVDSVVCPARADKWGVVRHPTPPLIAVTTSEVRESANVTLTRHGEPPQHEMALGLKYLHAVEAAGGIPVVVPPLHT